MPTHAFPARTSKLIAVLAVALAGIAVARAESPLRWKFKTGETLSYVLERTAQGKLNLTGSEITFNMGMTFDIDWKAQAVAGDGTAEVELLIGRIQINMSSPLGGNMTYDSQSPEKPAGIAWAQMEPMVTGMLGQTFRLKISPLGKVSDIVLPEKLAESFKKQQSQNRQMGFGIGGNAFSEKGIKELIEKSVLPLPDAAPDKDVTWNQHFENTMPSIGTTMTDTTFSMAPDETVDGKKLAKISAGTELTFEPVEKPVADLEILSQEASATFYFDREAGHLVKSNGSQSFFMELSGARELTQDMKETFSMHLGKSPAGKPAEKAEPAAAK